MHTPQTRRYVIGCAGAAVGLLAAGATFGATLEHHRRWATRAHVHFDRTASPWVIRRFIDPEAQFLFLEPADENHIPADAIAFAIPGKPLGPHDENGTTFEKLLKQYNLTDSALHQMGRVIAAGVDFVLHGKMPAPDDVYGRMAYGLLAVADGMPLVRGSDDENLRASFVSWDAMYATFKVNEVIAAEKLSPPDAKGGAGARIEFQRKVLETTGFVPGA